MITVRRDDDTLVVRDAREGGWILGLFLLAAGTPSLGAALGWFPASAALPPAMSLIGLASGAAGLALSLSSAYWFEQVEASFDTQERVVLLRHTSIRGRKKLEIPFEDVMEIDLRVRTDAGGDPLWRIDLVTGEGARLPLSLDPIPDRSAAEEAVESIRKSLEPVWRFH